MTSEKSQRPERGCEEGVLLEAIAASPSLYELVVERGDVETDTVLQQNIDVLERNGGGMIGDDGAQRRQGRLARPFIGDATQIGVEIEAVIHGHVSSPRVCCIMGSADIARSPRFREHDRAFQRLGQRQIAFAARPRRMR